MKPEEEEKSIFQSGILGMKWGHRKATNTRDVIARARGKTASSNASKGKTDKSKAALIKVKQKRVRTKAQIKAVMLRAKNKKLADIDQKRFEQARAAAGVALLTFGAVRMLQGPQY